jgi:peroxiredoxin
MPAMARLHGALEPQGLALVAVSVDDGRDEVARFQERLALPFPILLDPEKRVSRDYQTFRFPETFLIDREGVIVERYIGPKDWDAPAYLERLQRLLAEPAAGALR